MDQEKKTNWHAQSASAVFDQLNTTVEGLTSKEVGKRRETYGLNELPKQKTDSIFIIFLRQFSSPLLYILIIAGIIAVLLGEYIDGGVILAVLLLNGVIGAFQEGKAKAALDALRKYTKTESLVLRDGESDVVPSSSLVPGDIIILHEGDKVPADARLIEIHNLATNEAALTGESTPVGKSADPADEELSMADQKSMVFKGTTVSRGTAKAVVVATGIDTAIGKISQTLDTVDTDIPLKKNLKHISRLLIIGVIIAIVAIFGAGVLLGYPIAEMGMTSLSLLVSVVPEGLPVVMTLVLALGVRRMADQNALVKRLQAVEALAHTNVLAVDKTGTLTRNEMVVEEIFIGGEMYQVTGEGYDPTGEVRQDGVRVEDITPVQYGTYLSAISANAELHKSDAGTYSVTGDPTEAALLVLGEKVGHHKKRILEESPLVTELPFAHEKKYYVNVHRLDGEYGMIAAGAPDVLLDVCTSAWHPEGNQAIDEALRASLHEQVHEMASRGLRVLALVSRVDIDEADIDYDDVQHMNFVALYGMRDGLRSEIAESVRITQEAGMQLVMITGDHKDTATAIAKDAGILGEGHLVITGTELASMSVAELAEVLPRVRVFARVTPDMKLEIINAFRGAGYTIAMTGDGVNDVPPLLAADLGVAMGTIGTEVTKEAADIVLLDDNFATITKAVEEGRHIFNTIQRVLVYLLSTNLAELLVIVAAVIAVLPVPLTPAQLIWLNLVTDTFLVIALAFQKKEEGLLDKPFAQPTKYILDKADAIRLVLFGLIMAAGTFVVFLLFRADLPLARTMVLATLGMFQVFRLWSIRSDTQSIFYENPFKFPLLIAMSCLATGLIVGVVYLPFMQTIFETVPLSLTHWVIAIAVSISIIVIDEVRKIFVRNKNI